MPWTGKSFGKHSRKARGNPKAARGAAEAANAALREGKGEGAAVRIGNYVAKRVASRGGRRSRKSGRK